jgi:hypothetical protein
MLLIFQSTNWLPYLIPQISTAIFNRQVGTVTGEVILNIYNIISNDFKKHLNTSLIN